MRMEGGCTEAAGATLASHRAAIGVNTELHQDNVKYNI